MNSDKQNIHFRGHYLWQCSDQILEQFRIKLRNQSIKKKSKSAEPIFFLSWLMLMNGDGGRDKCAGVSITEKSADSCPLLFYASLEHVIQRNVTRPLAYLTPNSAHRVLITWPTAAHIMLRQRREREREPFNFITMHTQSALAKTRTPPTYTYIYIHGRASLTRHYHVNLPHSVARGGESVSNTRRRIFERIP